MPRLLLLGVETATTTSGTGVLLQHGRREGGRGGREQRGTHAGEMLTPVCFFIPQSSRDLSAAFRGDLTTYGMVGSTTGSRDRAVTEREEECPRV